MKKLKVKAVSFKLISIIGMMLFFNIVQAKTYYFDDVATHGSGTLASPFNDFSQIQYTLQAGDTLLVMPGNYTITQSIRFRVDGTSESPIVIRAFDPNNRPVISNAGSTATFRIQNSYQCYDGFIVDGQYVEAQNITIGGGPSHVEIRNCIVRRSKRDGILLNDCSNCTIDNCEIYYCLNGTFTSQTDAHGICAMHVRNLTVNNCNIHHVSGDCFQVDPQYDDLTRPLWDNVSITNCVMWTGNLPQNEGEYLANESPGENAIDTKADNSYRSTIYIKNVECYGFINTNGQIYISVRAAFNIKYNVRAIIDNCNLHDNQIAYRLRGPYTDPPLYHAGAHVVMNNCIGYNNLTNVWFERAVVAQLNNCTFDKRTDDKYFSFTFGEYNPADMGFKNCLFVGSKPAEASAASNIVAQPADFRNYVLHDYYPSANSVCIDKGVDIPELKYDISGYPRTLGFYDVGAYEYRSPFVITAPNGGEAWTVGSIHDIAWIATGTIANVNIDCSTNNGANWTSVASNTANDGTYSWTVPNTPSTTCLVRVSDAVDNDPSDTSNVVFTITTVETVSTPTTPTGPSSGLKGTSYSFTTNGSVSSSTHAVQYRFDWDDGSTSGWLAVGTTTASHSWAATGTYNVRAMARCASDTAIESIWSETHALVILATGKASCDFNGDGQSDIAVWRPSSGCWFIQGQGIYRWGTNGDVPVCGDYNGDGKTDIAVWRPGSGCWFIQGQGIYQWGANSDVPLCGDYDGDGQTDIAVWRPSNGYWYVMGQGVNKWGTNGDVPVCGDYNGDGQTDIAVWRPADGNWYIMGQGIYKWGVSGDVPVCGDYNGDGQTDIAVWRPADGNWYIMGQGVYKWGTNGDVPVCGDYNGDGKTDITVWRPSNGYWYVMGQGAYQWGTRGDIPLK